MLTPEMAPLDAVWRSLTEGVRLLRAEFDKRPRDYGEMLDLCGDLRYDLGLLEKALEHEQKGSSTHAD